jgi:hypothetical protein
LDPDCTLVEMARAQGEGVLRVALPGVLENTYVRRGGAWKILRVTHALGFPRSAPRTALSPPAV